MQPAPAPVVLVVDDDPETLAFIARVVESVGFQVKRAGSADEARLVAHAGSLDLIISDVNMPGMRGPEMIKGLKADGVACPVLLVSGEGSYEALSESLHVPGANFLPKPFGPGELIAAVFETLAPR
jgi:two-component system response regulator FixJ